jgi:hypothetical protein
MNRGKLLAERRTLLVTECALQRITLATQIDSLGEWSNWATAAKRLAQRLGTLPTWAGVAVVGMMVFAPKKVLSWLKSGVLLWQFWRAVSSRSGPPK